MAILAASSNIARVARRESVGSNFAMIGEWWSESGQEPQSQWSLARYCGPYALDRLGLFDSFAW